MNQTEDIKELVAALSKAQRKMEPAKFNRVNPYFKNRYADFRSCMDACRVPLADNGLSVMHYCETINDKLNLVTMLAHTSGQWIKSQFPLNTKNMDSQSIGSAMTYAKRYSLSALLGIVSDEEDDDGEASHGRFQQHAAKVNSQPVVKSSTAPISLNLSKNQVSIIKNLESKLDDECKFKLYAWMKNSFKVDSIEDMPADSFQKVFSAFENAVKFLEKQSLENSKLEVSNA